MYPFTVHFGPEGGSDAGYRGAHDIDIGAPPNHPVTALLPGQIVSITDGWDDARTVTWGRQVGVLLDQAYNGNKYLAYLHLSGVEPTLKEGQHVSKGDLIGWVGGGNNEADYLHTTNPTGINFTNPTSRSSQIQVGVALMRGKEYGHEGWTEYPDPASNPTQIILDAQNDFLKGEGDMLHITDPFAKAYFTQVAEDRWHCVKTNIDVAKDILSFYRRIGGAPRLPLTVEKSDIPGVVYQVFESAVIVYDKDHMYDRPAGFDPWYLLKLNSELAKKILH